MTPSLALNDILVWSLQIAFLIGLAAILPPVLRLKMPKAKLAFGQMVLVACLLLPLVRSWKQEVVGGTVTVSTGVVSIAQGPAARQFLPISIPTLVLLLAAAGILARFGFLLSGFQQLRRYRLHSQPLTPASAWGVEADLRISEEVASPVTFGFRKPVVLLPAGFPALSEGLRDAILCHEVLHIRRHDWLFMVGEELVRAVLWFHPAVWWLLREIQLVREQTVDRDVVEITRSRDRYIDALLVIAGAPPRIDLASAPLFLRKRHLTQRVVSIMKEVKMSKVKSNFALAGSLTILAVSGWFVTGEFRLQAAPQAVADAPGVSVETNGAQLMHRQSVAYPREAIAKGVQGTVVAEVNLDAAGNVTDARIVSGPDELRKAVLQSVLNWHFTKDAAPGTRQVSVSFESSGELSGAPKVVPGFGRAGSPVPAVVRPVGPLGAVPPQPVLKTITIAGLFDPQRDQLLAQLPIHVGDTASLAMMRDTVETVRAFDEHLGVSFSGDGTLYIATPDANRLASVLPPPQPSAGAFAQPPDAMRIPGEIQQGNLVSQRPRPVYPPLAKAARVQGKVVFEATIGKDGSVQNLQLMSGPPLLVQAAMDSVNQWVYKPTLLNGAPVAVVTTIEVNFTLSD